MISTKVKELSAIAYLMLVDWPAEMEIVFGVATGWYRIGGVIAGTYGYGV
jgi:hypothetical protein